MRYNPSYRLYRSVDFNYAKAKRAEDPDAFDTSMRSMNLTLERMCNPWYVGASFQLGKYVVGLANPFQNNLPLVPWL